MFVRITSLEKIRGAGLQCSEQDLDGAMNKRSIGILHPGEMGISLATAARHSGMQVFWASRGRSAATQARAEQQGLTDLETLQRVCDNCDVIIGICPPHAAESLANEVLACGYQGFYLDANAISPQRARRIADNMAAAGIRFIDGGIIGPPAWKPGTTWLFLSGADAHQVVGCFASSPLSLRVIGDMPGKASALKMVYAARTKGTTALIAAVLAAAEKLDVRKELEAQWNLMDHGAVARLSQNIAAAVPKAWRWGGEMAEIAATLEDAGLPPDFHRGAEEIYERLAHFKGQDLMPALSEVLEALIRGTDSDS
jgi:3-hydroxyisobutyrate dehydrogenase-like beta-hydroxyacid dehydrogenase